MNQEPWKELAAVGREVGQRLLAILPGRTPIDWSGQHAARWRSGPLGGELQPLGHLHAIGLDDLLGIDEQKDQLTANTEQFVRGYPANNALLWGARGTGKSSLIHALLNRYAADGLRLLEVDKHALADIAAIVARVDGEPYRFVLVCDDLSFEADDASYKALKSALEGSVFTQSANVLIYATSNRRHLLPEYMSENVAATPRAGRTARKRGRAGEDLPVRPLRPVAVVPGLSAGRLSARRGALAEPPRRRARRRFRVGRSDAGRGPALGAGAGRAQRSDRLPLRQAACGAAYCLRRTASDHETLRVARRSPRIRARSELDVPFV